MIYFQMSEVFLRHLFLCVVGSLFPIPLTRSRTGTGMTKLLLSLPCRNTHICLYHLPQSVMLNYPEIVMLNSFQHLLFHCRLFPLSIVSPFLSFSTVLTRSRTKFGMTKLLLSLPCRNILNLLYHLPQSVMLSYSEIVMLNLFQHLLSMFVVTSPFFPPPTRSTRSRTGVGMTVKRGKLTAEENYG